MENNCLNCNRPIVENFCSNCGQKKYRRIDRKYLVEELQYSLVHTNKGFFYSIKNIFKNPGRTAREFIEGNRVNHYKPILLAFVLSGISAFISYKVIGFQFIMTEVLSQKGLYSGFMAEMLAFISSYNSFMMLLLIPFFAILTKLAFRKWGHNYYEHVVMNAFVLSFYTIINILFLYPLMYIMKDRTDLFMILMNVSMLTVPVILIWFYKGFYKERKFKTVILRVLLILLILFIIYIILVFTVAIIYLVTNPEALKQLQPKV